MSLARAGPYKMASLILSETLCWSPSGKLWILSMWPLSLSLHLASHHSADHLCSFAWWLVPQRAKSIARHTYGQNPHSAQCHVGHILLVQQVRKSETDSTPWREEWLAHFRVGILVFVLKTIFYTYSCLNSKSRQMKKLQTEFTFWEI